MMVRLSRNLEERPEAKRGVPKTRSVYFPPSRDLGMVYRDVETVSSLTAGGNRLLKSRFNIRKFGQRNKQNNKPNIW